MARSMARAIFSPTTDPMLPMRNAGSVMPTTTGYPPMVADPVITASFSPVAFR